MKCDKCGVDRASTLKRLFLGEILVARGFFILKPDHKGDMVKQHYDPNLCATCCSDMPGRAWMKTAAADTDTQVA